MVTQCLSEASKKPDKARILAFVAFLRSCGYVITLKPLNGANLRVIEVAA